jgi:hypothetical protein
MQPGRDQGGEYKQQDFQAGAHRASDMGRHATCYHDRGGFAAKFRTRQHTRDTSHAKYS